MINSIHTIIIIDDNADWCDVLDSRIRQEPGLDIVAVAYNGREALPLIEFYKPDIILLDIVMPEYDGVKVLNLIRKIDDYHPVIYVITGHITKSMVRLLNDLNIQYYDFKPIDIEDVIANIRTIISEHPKPDAGGADESANTGEPEPIGEPGALPEEETESIVLDILLDSVLCQLGMPHNISGFHILKSAMQMSFRDETCLRSIPERIYAPIAESNKLTVGEVERYIHYAILQCNRRRTELFEELVSPADKKKPSNPDFMRALYAHLKLQLEGG